MQGLIWITGDGYPFFLFRLKRLKESGFQQLTQLVGLRTKDGMNFLPQNHHANRPRLL
jgi:hypothetical protein